MDISDTLAPKSDQLDYEDMLSGPKTLTITEVRRGPSAEQPVEIAFKEFDRPWRPAKTVRRMLVACWGADASLYTGRRVTLFGDPAVKWGGVAVGGIRLSHASHIDKPVTVSLTVTRGQRKPFIVQPLPDAAPAPQANIDGALKAIHTAPDTAALDAIETKANQLGIGEHVNAAISKRRAELEGEK